MKLLTSIIIFIVILQTNVSALTKFSYDNANGEWKTYNTGYYTDIPIRELSNNSDIHVEWDGKYIWVKSGYRDFRFNPNSLPYGIKIINGATYVSPERLSIILYKTSFFYGDELYIFDGEPFENVNGSKNFCAYVSSAMFMIKLYEPEIYDIIFECLSGGIQSTKLTSNLPTNTKAYVYSSSCNPICYIIEEPYGIDLAGYITHEAFHVWQWRNYKITGEELPNKAQNYILDKLGMMYS